MKLVARLWLCSFSPPSNWQGRSFNGRMVWSDQTEGWTQLQRGGICLHVSNHAKLTSSTILHWKNRAKSKHEKPNGWGSPGPNTNTDHLMEDSLGRYCLRPLKRQKERWSLSVFGPGEPRPSGFMCCDIAQILFNPQHNHHNYIAVGSDLSACTCTALGPRQEVVCNPAQTIQLLSTDLDNNCTSV